MGKSLFVEYKASYDGTHQKTYEDHVFFGTYFFLYELRREETRTVFNFVRMLSEFGGMYVSVMAVIGGLAKFINTHMFMKDMIKDL